MTTIPERCYFKHIHYICTRKGIKKNKQMSNISSFIKYQRKKNGLTQEELALKTGVRIRFIREMEQGKESLQFDKIEQVLSGQSNF